MGQRMIRIDDDLYTELEKIKDAVGGSVASHAAVAIRKGLRGENSMLEEILSGVEDVKLMLETPIEVTSEIANYDLKELEKIEIPKSKHVQLQHTPPEKNIAEGKPSNIADPKAGGRKTAGALPVNGQMPCCKSRTTMCKHWVWQDTGDGYVNKLDGEIIEVGV